MFYTKLINNTRGFTLFEVLIAVAISAVVIGLIMEVPRVIFSTAAGMRRHVDMQDLRTDIILSIIDDRVFAKTIEASPSLSCFDGNSASCVGGNLRFSRDATGTKIYDFAASEATGLAIDGSECNTFSNAGGNDQCPLRLELTWEKICTGACDPGLIKINADFKYSPKTLSKGEAAFQNLNFSIVRHVAASAPPAVSGIAIAAGYSWTCMVNENGRVQCWGQNKNGAVEYLGANRSDAFISYPVEVVDQAGDPIEDVEYVTVGSSHSCAIQSGGRVQCWGSNSGGDLGRPLVSGGAYNFAAPVVDSDAVTPLAGVTHVTGWAMGHCASTTTKLLCWGANVFKRLGIAPYSDPPNTNFHSSFAWAEVHPVPTRVFTYPAGWPTGKGSHFTNGNISCLITDNKQVTCFGANTYGELGQPAPLDSSAEMDLDPSRRVMISAGVPLTNIESLAGGTYYPNPDPNNPGSFICALEGSGDRNVWCWGRNSLGTLGLAGPAYRSLASRVGGGEMGTTYLKDIRQIRAAYTKACGITLDNSLFCWGLNGGYQSLGKPNTLYYSSDPVEIVPLRNKVVDIGIGDSHMCAILTDKSVQCWGSNAYGQMGNNTSGGVVWPPVTVSGTEP